MKRTTGAAIVAGATVAMLAALPLIPVTVPLLFDGPLNSPGTLNLLALCLVFGVVALTYDLLFGFTGLLSFGHALYFALGVYVTAIALGPLGWSLPGAVAATAIAGIVVPLVIGAICLRVGDIAFAMVTLAFAEAAHIFVLRDPVRITGGEEGLALGFERLPEWLIGVVNTRNLYWLALAYAVVAYAAIWWAVRSRPGRVWQAIRDNERRVEVIGLRTYPYKLGALVLSSFLATLAGAVYLLAVRGASPSVTTATFTLTLLVMVVLGGTGTLWGAVLGGVVYTYLDHRLVELASSPTVQQLPAPLRTPLSEPLFMLGTLFVVLVLFFPSGIAGLRDVRAARRLRRALVRDHDAPRDANRLAAEREEEHDEAVPR